MTRYYLTLLALALVAGIGAAHAGTVNLSWTLPSAYTDGSPLAPADIREVRVYGAQQGTTKVLLATLPGTATAHTRTNVTGGQTHCYELTVVAVNGQESAHTNEVCRAIPLPVPNPPTVVTVAVVAGIDVVPAFKILADGSRSTAVAGFVPVGTACAGEPVFSYRSRTYRRVAADAVRWWQTARTDQVAAPCA